MPATFFVVSSFIRREDWVWTDKVLWLSEQPSRPIELSADKIELLFATLNQLRPGARTASIEAIAARMGVSIPGEAEVESSKPTWQDIEKAIVAIVQAGVYYKKKKDDKFMQNYKTRYTELHQAEDPDIYILDNAKRIYPNEDKYIEMKKQYQEWYKK